jgi:co-chaperonin GroES (HSP10)|uniref:Co-chaperonin GroES n=1 Tax=uncultured virus TaxID=340016 RepID=A0A221S2Y8_9VIRU|nr:co-chaperonin GroES [uncultured virus]
MSELLIGTNPDNPEEATTIPDTAEQKAKQLPDPSGYRILCGIPEIENKYESGIVKADVTKQHEELLTTVLFVMKMGPDCYKDKDRFPSGPWCKEGDFVLVRPHAGTRLKIHGTEFRIINDDSVEGVVEDPRGISRT